MKILYVEDNPANVFLVKRVARMGKHEIINYIDGNQAIEKFDEVNPDLVLMDIQLAGDKSGLDVVKELRARGVKTDIIAVTAYAMVGDKERCIEAGCTDYLAKPLPIPRLVEIFKRYSDEVIAKAASTTKPEETSVEPVAKVEEKVSATVADTKDTASDVVAKVEDKTSETVADTKDTASDVVAKVEDKVSETVADTKDTASDVVAKVEDKVSETVADAKDTASDVVAKVEDKTSQTVADAKDTASDVVAKVEETTDKANDEDVNPSKTSVD